MTITLRDAPAAVSALAGVRAPSAALRCVVCGEPFDFAAGESAVVLRHVAYGHDFVHDGRCLATARELLFAEPGYDCPALGPDPLRRRVMDATPADGWSATRAPAPGAAGGRVRHEPLRWWALIELADGRRQMEGVARDEDWLDEPGGATLPAAARDFLGYAGPAGELIRAA